MVAMQRTPPMVGCVTLRRSAPRARPMHPGCGRCRALKRQNLNRDGRGLVSVRVPAPRFARALADESSSTADALAANFRRVEHGLLSVGLKIHCLDNGEKFDKLIEGLGGASKILEVNHYKDARASLCLVLPPVGSATSATQLIECIEQFIGSPIFGNRQIQLQLCSPGATQRASVRVVGHRILSRLRYAASLHAG